MPSERFRLNHCLSGYPRDTGAPSESIPSGSEILIVNWNYQDEDSLVACNGREFNTRA